MGVREVLNGRGRSVGLAVAVGVIGLAGLSIGSQLFRSDIGSPIPAEGHYTIDDGKTWFEGPFVDRPLEVDGQRVARVQLFTCDGGETVFPGWLERPTASALEELRGIQGDTSPEANRRRLQLLSTSREVKKPGGMQWVDPLSAGSVTTVEACPHPEHSADQIEPVL